MATNKRIRALEKYLRENGNEVHPGDLRVADYDKCLVVDGSRKYLVLSGREADRRARDCIKDSVWTFNADFIADRARIPYDTAFEVVKALQPKCEDANDAISGLVKNMRKFADDVIQADGRAHFLSDDGNEEEMKLGNVRYYIYRQS